MAQTFFFSAAKAVFVWDSFHVKPHDDAFARSVHVTGNEFLAQIMQDTSIADEVKRQLTTALHGAQLTVSEGCVSLVAEGNSELQLLEPLLLTNKHLADRVGNRACQLLESTFAEDESLRVACCFAPRPQAAIDKRLVLSVLEVAVASTRRGNDMASTAARSLSLIAVAHGNKFKDVYCVFVSPTQPFRFGERMAGGEPSDRLKLEYWLKAASFVSFDGGDQYRTPNRSFIFLLTCGAALHRHCAKAVVQLLDSAGVESTFQLAECPPIDGKMLFRTDVRERLFRHAMSDQSAVGLAVRHVTAAPIDGEDSTSQLLSLGFDPGRPENDRLFAVARAQSGKSVRSWAYDHLMHVFLARGILHVPLIGDATKMQRSVDTDEIVGARKVAVRKRDSWTLLGRRYIANQPRLAQLVIDVPALLGDIGVEDNWIVLCHGTTIAAASLILSSSCNVGSPLSDFGSAFYTTEQIQYALQCAYFKADCGDTNNRDHDPAVIIFAFPRDKLDELPPYFVRDHAWQHLVTARHRGEMNKLPPNERARAYAADVTVGAVSANAGFIASTEQREVARPMVGITQHAFHERATNILDVVGIEYGRVAVLRVLVNAHEWGVATDTD